MLLLHAKLLSLGLAPLPEEHRSEPIGLAGDLYVSHAHIYV
jgi:hypothetical protein